MNPLLELQDREYKTQIALEVAKDTRKFAVTEDGWNFLREVLASSFLNENAHDRFEGYLARCQQEADDTNAALQDALHLFQVIQSSAGSLNHA